MYKRQEVTDEFVVPTVCADNATVESGDSVIFFNFRPDRAREITRTFVDPEFSGFERKKGFFPLTYVCMTQYDATMPNVQVAFHPQSLKNTFGEYISDKGLTQLRIAETEKYAHVTFFFNGGVEKTYPGEDRALINSPKVATYDLQPEMSAYLVTDEVVKRIESGKYDVIILNFANCDMVGPVSYTHLDVYKRQVKNPGNVRKAFRGQEIGTDHADFVPRAGRTLPHRDQVPVGGGDVPAVIRLDIGVDPAVLPVIGDKVGMIKKMHRISAVSYTHLFRQELQILFPNRG